MTHHTGLHTFLELHGDPLSIDSSALPIEVVGEAANGVQATPRIVESSPHSRVIILTSFSEEDKGFPAIRAGAQGYLLKDIAPNDLTDVGHRDKRRSRCPPSGDPAVVLSLPRG